MTGNKHSYQSLISVKTQNNDFIVELFKQDADEFWQKSVIN